MRKRWISAGLAAGALILSAGAASAQALQVTLQDGRTFSLPASVRGCTGTPSRGINPPAQAVDFSCTVPEEDGGRPSVAGTGGVVVAPSAQRAGSVDLYLDSMLRGWWPDITAELIASNKTRVTKATARGRIALICIYRDNVAALNGDAVCVVDQAGLQVVIHGQSTMASTADNVIDTLLASVTVR